MRKLIIIRIVHAPSDMGTAGAGLEKAGVSVMGEARWKENQLKIEKFWNELEAEVDGLGLDMNKVHIYQDGLPCAGQFGERIVRETAARGSRNYLIVLKLMDQGARIEATEKVDLLRQEYGYIKAILEAKTDSERRAAEAQYDRVKDELLLKRDEFIAGAIDKTLKDGETGLLFIGASHNVLAWIASDIEVRCLD